MTYNQLTTEQFIERARKIHGDTYDYSECDYTSMNNKVRIICKNHGIFEQNAGSHINPLIKAGCPYCAGKSLFKGENDLQSQYPEIAKSFDEEKNNCKADEVFAKSNKKYWWLCDKGHSFDMSPNNRSSKGYSCPYCSGQRLLKGFNDLVTIHPDIAKEWDYQQNEGEPSDYRYGSGYKAWWVCKDCGESYQSPINIHIKGHKCPYCSGLKIKSGRNDLQTLFPDIAKEYAPDNEVPVDKISASTHKKVKWICPKCLSEYFASPHHRTSKDKTECPYCKKQSKGERKVKAVLDKYSITYKEQEWFDDLRHKRPLKFDFTLYKDGRWVGAIEYNGEQHYKVVSCFGNEKDLALRKDLDNKKIAYCIEHKIPILSLVYDHPHRFMSLEDEIVRYLQNIGLVERN